MLIIFFLGCPCGPLGLGSGCVVARKSARPCSFFAALKNLGLRLRRTTFHPSAAHRFSLLHYLAAARKTAALLLSLFFLFIIEL